MIKFKYVNETVWKMGVGFENLPPEVVLKILSFVAHDDIRSVRLVNRRLNEQSKDKSLWRKVRFYKLFHHNFESFHQILNISYDNAGGVAFPSNANSNFPFRTERSFKDRR